MTRRLILRPAVVDDLHDACRWYDKQLPGLGDRFKARVKASIDEALRRPFAFTTIYRTLRRIAVQRFPYGVFYYVNDDAVVVVGVFHGRQSSRRWKRRSE